MTQNPPEDIVYLRKANQSPCPCKVHCVEQITLKDRKKPWEWCPCWCHVEEEENEDIERS